METFEGEQWKTWLCRIASNASIDYLRKASHREVATEEDFFSEITSTDMENEPLQRYMNQETMKEVEATCQTLKEPYAQIAILVYCRGKTTEEIAKITGKNIKTVQTQIYRARNQLREILRKDGEKHGQRQ